MSCAVTSWPCADTVTVPFSTVTVPKNELEPELCVLMSSTFQLPSSRWMRFALTFESVTSLTT